MTKNFILLLILVIFVGCQASGGGAPGGGIISGHVPVENKFTLSTTSNTTYTSGQSISFTLTYPVPVTITGTPKLTVTVGSSTVDADFVSVTGNSLLFQYTVQVGDNDSDGIAVASTVNLNGGTCQYNGTENCSLNIIVPSLSSVKVSAIAGSAPVANNITPANFNEDTSSTITLSYADADGDLSTSCTISGLNKVFVSTPCACAAGVCTVGVTGSANQNGAAGFSYIVTSLGQTSNTATATFTLTPVADAPVAINITPAAFNEDTQSVITLSYTDADGDLASSCSISAPTNVTVTQACACALGTCTVGVTGTSNYSGVASFNYTVTANGQPSNSATASLTITSVNDAPVANNITPAAFNEDVQSIITLSYTDAESSLATACSIVSPTNVTVTQACACAAGTCTVGVTGTTNYNGAAGFGYTVNAGGQNSNTATATFTINAVDDAPVASNITPPAFNKDTQSIITLSYTDVESNQATVCSISGLSNVTVTQACACAAGICTVGVTGTAGYFGAASFDYTVTANGLSSNTATASLTINDVDTAPVADNITPPAFNEDVQSVITLSYSDADSDQATTCAIASPTNVTVTQACACAAGTCTVGVTGTSNYNGAASFTYTVTANSATSNSATATLSITAVDDAPVASNLTPPAFNKNTQSIITLVYTDVESDLATTCSLSNLSNVTVTQACACAAGTCTVGVTGTLNYFGAASFDYTVTANSAVSNTASAALTINNTDAAPVADNITPPAFNEDTQSVITLSYTDADSDQATTCSIGAPTNVTVTQACACAAGTCTVGVTGTSDYNGAASFTYTVTANSVASNSATATLSITAVDDAPVASNITPAAFNENTQSVITLSYADVDSDLATTCSISNLSNVTVTQACACAAGTCTVGVTGTLNYFGAASFDYTVTANSVVSNTASASLTINNVDNAPVADNITPPAFNEDVQSVITLSYTDADSDLATTCAIASPTNVSVTQACACAAGSCTVGVSGTSNYNGAASFTYTVTANSATSNSATSTLSITAVDDAPVASNITPPSFYKNAQSVMTLSYTDVESDQATTCSISNLSNVTVTQACACAAGTCTVGVTGTSNYTGAASFDYTVTANSAVSNTASSSFTITSAVPVADNITPPAFNEDVQSVITLSYSDADSDLATSCTISSPTNVSVTQACACAAGTCTVGVTGTTDYNGAASFNYTVTAAGDTSNSASATLTINAVADAPVASNITPAAFNEDTQSVITLSYTDAESDQATTCAISNESNVTVTQACACVAGTCTVGVTGTSNYSGSASFDYTVTANSQTSNTATATLSITAVNDAPVADNITPPAFNEDLQSVITLSYTDSESDQATTCTISSPTNVSVTQACACASGTCTVGVTGSSNYNGAASFSYTVTAASQTSNSASATLTINAVDDAPVASNITPPSFYKNTQSVITLSYTDVESDAATSCSISGESNVTVTQACACAAGTCTVGVTGTSGYTGAASFNYTVTSNSLTSNSASASLTITSAVPVADNITPPAFNEDIQSVITLSYSDADGDQASTCTISSPSNVSVTQACACSSGTCTVGVTSDSNYNGSASFNYTVTTAGDTSNSATATLTINPVDDAPVSINITPPAFDEDVQSLITLSYTDPEGDFASSCSISGLSNVTVTQACSCTLGTCTVGVTGTANYSGTASFDYTVTANSLTSNTATASLTISSVLEAPTVSTLNPPAFNEDTQSIITLTYTNNGDAAVSCSVSSPTNVTVTQACACSSGTCTVGVTGTSNYNGSASFQFMVSAGPGADSNTATANLTINPADDAASLGAIGAQSGTPNTATSAIAFTFNDPDGAVCSSARLSMTSSNPTLVANASVVWGGTAPNCTATITPQTNQTGSTSITITATDGGLSSKTTNFTLTVTGALFRWEFPVNTVITAYSFGTPGGNTSVTVKVKNFGNASATPTMSNDGGSSKITSSSTCGSIAAGGTCDYVINWTQSGSPGYRQTIFTATGAYNAESLTASGTR